MLRCEETPRPRPPRRRPCLPTINIVADWQGSFEVETGMAHVLFVKLVDPPAPGLLFPSWYIRQGRKVPGVFVVPELRLQQLADHLKLMLPFTVALTNMAWGASDGQAMIAAGGHTAIVNDVLDRFAEFLIRCHTGPGEFVAGVPPPPFPRLLLSCPGLSSSLEHVYCVVSRLR